MYGASGRLRSQQQVPGTHHRCCFTYEACYLSTGLLMALFLRCPTVFFSAAMFALRSPPRPVSAVSAAAFALRSTPRPVSAVLAAAFALRSLPRRCSTGAQLRRLLLPRYTAMAVAAISYANNMLLEIHN